MPPQGRSRVNFLSANITLVSLLWETIMWFCREAFLWILDAQPSHSKLYLILTWNLKSSGELSECQHCSQSVRLPLTLYYSEAQAFSITREIIACECSDSSIFPHRITTWNYTKCSFNSGFYLEDLAHLAHWMQGKTCISAPQLHVPLLEHEKAWGTTNMEPKDVLH